MPHYKYPVTAAVLEN